MKQEITDFIKSFVKEYENRDEIATSYGEPLVGFADANHPYIQSLPELIGPTHELPQNVLPDARIIIAYFVPFTKELAKTNRSGGTFASPEWARAYEETNALFVELNEKLIDFIHAKAGHAGVTPKAVTFDQSRLVSDWSHRHIAFAAGLGTFGVNNMLLTRRGCCGRFSTVITNLDLMPDVPVEGEYCLWKKNGTCGACVKHCPTGNCILNSEVPIRMKTARGPTAWAAKCAASALQDRHAHSGIFQRQQDSTIRHDIITM